MTVTTWLLLALTTFTAFACLAFALPPGRVPGRHESGPGRHEWKPPEPEKVTRSFNPPTLQRAFRHR